MKQQLRQMTTVGLLLLSGAIAQAGPKVGYNCVEVPANSDAVISVPFNIVEMFADDLTVASINGSTLAVADTPFAGENFANLYYVRFTSGAANGKWRTITSNNDSSLTLASLPAGVSVNDTFQVIVHATLGNSFPAFLEGVAFTPSANPFAATGTQVLFPNTATGVNKNPSSTYIFTNFSGVKGWRLVGNPAVANNKIIPPGTAVTVRNASGSPLQVYTFGAVEEGALTVELATGPLNDTLTTTGRPVLTSLDELSLGGTSAFVASANPFAASGDQLLVFNNAAPGQNKNPSATYIYTTFNAVSGWRAVGNPAVVGSTVKLNPSEGFLIRKVAGTAGTVDWSNPSFP